jgi:uncharacterized membrane protein YkgB
MVYDPIQTPKPMTTDTIKELANTYNCKKDYDNNEWHHMNHTYQTSEKLRLKAPGIPTANVTRMIAIVSDVNDHARCW